MKSPVIKRIATTDALYADMRALRDEVLRRPLGLSIQDDDPRKDDNTILLVAMEDDRMTGCVILQPLSNAVTKLRAMAVCEDRQGQGLGRQLVTFAEKTAQQEGFSAIELHARISARAFYERLGYTATGAIFTEVTVPHILMKKVLA